MSLGKIQDNFIGLFQFLIIKLFLSSRGYSSVSFFNAKEWHHRVFLFKGLDPQGRKVVIKTSGTYNASKREYNSLKRLNKNEKHLFPLVYAYYNLKYFSFVIMEFIDGIKIEKGAIDKDTFSKFSQEVIHVLSEENVVHRDIRPNNILVNQSGDLYLIDFGWSIIAGVYSDDLNQKFVTISAIGETYKPSIMKWNDSYSFKIIFREYFDENIDFDSNLDFVYRKF